MAYKFQLGNAILSGSLTQKEGLNAGDDGLSNAGAITGATTIAASGLASVGSIAVDNGSTIGTDSDTDMLTLTNGSDIAVANDLDFNVAKAGGLQLAGAAVTSTAAELNLVDGSSAGTIVNSKAVIYGSSGEVNATTLQIGGTSITSTAAELNHLDGIADEAYDASEDSVVFFDVTDNKLKYEAANDFAGAIAGGGLDASSGALAVQVSGAVHLEPVNGKVAISGSIAGNGLAYAGGVDSISGLSVNVDDSSIEINADSLRVKASGVTNAMLAGSIENAKLTNSDVTIGSTVVNLGDTVTSFSGLTGLDFTAANASIAASIGANTLTLGGATSTIRVAGDLDVVGTLNRVTETELLIEDKVVIVASGSANAAAAAGAGLKIDIATGDMTWLYQANGESNATVDASSSGDIWMASGSSGLIAIQADKFYGGFVGDGASLTGIVADAVVENVDTKTANYSLDNTSETIVLADASSNSVQLTLPAASGLGGVVFKVKRIDNILANNVTIVPDTGESLEFVTNNTVYLETQGAALSLVCNGSAWFIM